MSYEEAACLPVAYGTALRMMYTIGRVKAGEKVLILGASGGVGSCCVQLAKLAGCEVIACSSSSPEKLERLKALGADHLHRLLATQLTDWVLREIRQAAPAQIHSRRRRRRQLHRRRHLGAVAAHPAPAGQATDVRRDRRLRPQGRHPLHLDFRAAGAGLQRLDARRHRAAVRAREEPQAAAGNRPHVRAGGCQRGVRSCSSNARSSERWWCCHERNYSRRLDAGGLAGAVCGFALHEHAPP